MAAAPPVGYAARIVAGFMVPVLTLVSAMFFWFWVYAVLSLVTTREAFGVLLPEDVPLWAGVLILVLVYQSVAWPLKTARRASYEALGGPHHAAVAALDGILSVAVAVLVVWFGYRYVPDVRELLHSLPEAWDRMRLM